MIQNQDGDTIESVIRCSLWNVRSLNNKLGGIMEHILDRDADIVFLTETWLQSDTNNITAEIKTYGYKLLHDRRKDRAKETGGGVGIMAKTGLAAKQQPVRHYESFEHTVVNIPLANKKKLILISIYRVLFVTEKVFLNELAELFDEFVVSNEHFIIAGDVNIHVETTGS